MKIKTRRYYYYYALLCGANLLWLLPIRFAIALGRISGCLAFLLIAKYRKVTLGNLRRAFPSKTDNELFMIGRRVFENATANYAELVQTSKLNKYNIDRWVTAHDLARVDHGFSRGKGVIILTAHFGNWELVGSYFRIKGYPGATIVRKVYFERFDRILNRYRAVHDVGIIYRDESPKKMLRLLKDNKILGMLADQDIESVEGVFVDFFGRQAYTPTAPVKMALASGAVIIPCYMLRRAEKYDFFVDEPIVVAMRSSKEETIQFYTQKWTKVLESYIMKYPDQWVWMHKRWKTQPSK
ncbi:MAG: lysophospholipid acyltransferase family protein [Candidatus Omnitrophica bacterium]|nr:lysophospholipid acyltransferase family protein [Candidatus Omnitrophota bacterium]